jgi:hypothetical protein
MDLAEIGREVQNKRVETGWFIDFHPTCEGAVDTLKRSLAEMLACR